MFEPALKFLVEQGGWGTIFGLLMGIVAYLFWRRNSQLVDEKTALGEKFHQVVEEARADREELHDMLRRVEKELADLRRNSH
jgi:F0F1-type ATP synthase membrane subunit b/b'